MNDKTTVFKINSNSNSKRERLIADEVPALKGNSEATNLLEFDNKNLYAQALTKLTFREREAINQLAKKIGKPKNTVIRIALIKLYAEFFGENNVKLAELKEL